MDMPIPDYQQLTRMWLDFVTRMTSAATTAVAESVPADAAKHMRDSYLQALGQYTEDFMRSPQFLEMVKQSTDAAINLRQQSNDMLAQAQHAVGGVARPDVDSILQSVRRCETRVLDRIDELSTRVDQLERELRSLRPNNGKRARTSAK
jgi:hypothetical protein